MHPPTSPPRQRKRLLYATAIFVAMLLCAGALWGWRTYTHARKLRDHTSTLTVALASDVATVDSSLAAIASDLDALQRDLRLPLPVAQHLRWVPKYGPAIAAVPEALCAAELAVSGLQRTWSVIGLPLFALRENPTDSA